MPSVPARVCFGAFELDLRSGELRKQGVRVKLQEQPFRVLQVLLERHGEVVTREELRSRVWPSDTFVNFDHGLSNAIKKLRLALGDSAVTPRFIETLSKRGYRFIAPLHTDHTQPRSSESRGILTLLVAKGREVIGKVAPRPSPSYSKSAGPILLTLIMAAILLSGLLGVRSGKLPQWLASKSAAAPSIHSLAILPLENLSGDPAQEYFSDGMTDALITELGQIGSLRVISRTSVMRYKKTDKSLPQIARELNVDGIIEGTVQRSGDRVRVTAQLIYGPSDKHIWAASYERETRDFFVLERDLTREIASQVLPRLTTGSKALVLQPRPVNATALDAYLQGNYHLRNFGRGFGDTERSRAGEYFQQAIDADPLFAPAYVGLANSHMDVLWPSDQDSEIATSAAEKAVELDPNFSDAHVTLAAIKESRYWDFRGAEEELQRAVELNPNSANAHGMLGHLLALMGRPAAGLSEGQTAQLLDPAPAHRLPDRLYSAGEYDRSIALATMMLHSDPQNGYLHHTLYFDYAAKGMYKEASQQEEIVLSLFGDPQGAARMHHALVTSGGRAAIRQLTTELEHWIRAKQGYVPVNLAVDYAILGERDHALDWLEEAFRHHDTVWVTTDIPLEDVNAMRMLDPFRSDPRFKDLVRRVGLPQ